MDDLQSLFLRCQPHSVHFSGHGDASGKVVIEDDAGLSRLFAVLKENIRWRGPQRLRF